MGSPTSYGAAPYFPLLQTENAGAGLSGSTVVLQGASAVHSPANLDFGTAVNVQAFTTSFEFQTNGWNLAFYLQNVTHNAGAGPTPGYTLSELFGGGAGCEGGFYQAFGPTGDPPANNIFVLNIDSGNLLVNSLTPFYSNVQIYQQLQSPCIPDDNQPYYYPSNKVSTSPVPMFNASASPQYTSCFQTLSGTCDTYKATVVYSGSNLTINMYDVTSGGTCSPVNSGSCFSYTWYNLSIPSWVDGVTAYAGFGGATNGTPPGQLVLDDWTYTVLSTSATPSISPSGGAYSSNQTVTISDASSGSIICYNTTGNPSTNGIGGCANGTLYTGSIGVSKGEIIYAVAGSGTSGYRDSAVTSAVFNINGTAAQPTFSVAPGSYQGNQTLILTAAQGSVICYNTTGSPATNGSTGCTTGTAYSGPITISSNETVYAVAGGTGLTDSSVGSAAYVISPFAVEYGYTGSYPANSPTYSPLPGTYSGAQNVSLSTTTSGAYICYVVSATLPALLPQPNSLGGCSVGTLYSGSISVASSETVYASAGTTVGADLIGTGPTSSVATGTYTIGSGQTPGTPTNVQGNPALQ